LDDSDEEEKPVKKSRKKVPVSPHQAHTLTNFIWWWQGVRPNLDDMEESDDEKPLVKQPRKKVPPSRPHPAHTLTNFHLIWWPG
jgi:hypothetical protein